MHYSVESINQFTKLVTALLECLNMSWFLEISDMCVCMTAYVCVCATHEAVNN